MIYQLLLISIILFFNINSIRLYAKGGFGKRITGKSEHTSTLISDNLAEDFAKRPEFVVRHADSRKLFENQRNFDNKKKYGKKVVERLRNRKIKKENEVTRDQSLQVRIPLSTKDQSVQANMDAVEASPAQSSISSSNKIGKKFDVSKIPEANGNGITIEILQDLIVLYHYSNLKDEVFYAYINEIINNNLHTLELFVNSFRSPFEDSTNHDNENNSINEELELALNIFKSNLESKHELFLQYKLLNYVVGIVTSEFIEENILTQQTNQFFYPFSKDNKFDCSKLQIHFHQLNISSKKSIIILYNYFYGLDVKFYDQLTLIFNIYVAEEEKKEIMEEFANQYFEQFILLSSNKLKLIDEDYDSKMKSSKDFIIKLLWNKEIFLKRLATFFAYISLPLTSIIHVLQ